MALDVKGKVSLDGSGFDRTLQGLGGKITGFANTAKTQIAGAFIAAFGASAIKRFAIDIVQSAVKVDQLARKFNLTTTQVQQLQEEADRTGEPFEKLVENADELEKILSRISDKPVLFNRQQVENLLAINEGFKELENSVKKDIVDGTFFDRLKQFGFFGLGGLIFPKSKPIEAPETTPEQEAFLEKEAKAARAKAQAAKDAVKAAEEAKKQGEKDEAAIKRRDDAARNLNFSRITDKRGQLKFLEEELRVAQGRASRDFSLKGRTPEEQANLDAEAIRKRQEVEALRRELAKPGTLSLNSLQQIGGYAGPNPILDLNRQQLSQLQIIAREAVKPKTVKVDL